MYKVGDGTVPEECPSKKPPARLGEQETNTMVFPPERLSTGIQQKNALTSLLNQPWARGTCAVRLKRYLRLFSTMKSKKWTGVVIFLRHPHFSTGWGCTCLPVAMACGARIETSWEAQAPALVLINRGDTAEERSFNPSTMPSPDRAAMRCAPADSRSPIRSGWSTAPPRRSRPVNRSSPPPSLPPRSPRPARTPPRCR